MRTLPFLLSLALPACDAGKDTGDTGADTGDTSADTSDTSDTSGDTSDTSDTGDTGAPDADLRVVPLDAAAFAGATLGLFPLTVDFVAVTEATTPAATFALGDDGAFAVDWAPPADALVEAAYAPGMFVAVYALVAYVDAPTDEGLVGIARYDALYVEGEVPEPYASLGVAVGWNALSVRGEGDPPELVDATAVPLEDNLVVRTAWTAGGAWDGVAGDRVAGVSDQDPTVAVGDVPAADPWTVAVDGRPPASTFFEYEGVAAAGFELVAYDDVDASGGWSDGDTVTGRALTPAGEPAWLAWGDTPTDVSLAHTLVTLGGFRAGWSVTGQREIAVPLDDALATSLTMAAP